MAEAMRQLPQYQCHKRVRALRIDRIMHDGDGAEFTPADAGYSPFRVDPSFVMKHAPKPGGYYVVYEDGYESYSPAAAFEAGYTKL